MGRDRHSRARARGDEIRPRWERLAELGFSARDFGFSISALSDGAFVDELILQDDKIDIFLFGDAGYRQELAELEALPVGTPAGSVLPLGALADIVETVDTAEIRRVNGRRTVTLYVIPPRSIALETAVDTVRETVVRPMRESGELPDEVSLTLTGASDQLEATRASLGQNLWIAVDPILIVDRTMQEHRENGAAAIEAVKAAVASRLRPVLMTTCTTIVGLSPLVFLPGEGTELYRGVGAIVLFGLAFTAVVTLTFLPSLLVTILTLGGRRRRDRG